MQTFQLMAQQQQFMAMTEFMNKKKISELILKVILCIYKNVYIYICIYMFVCIYT